MRREAKTLSEYRASMRTVWYHMLLRCNTPTYKDYPEYGGRGIAVCPEWQDFESFYAWVLLSGHRFGLYLDRVNNDGPYSPDNCKWSTPKESARNTRRNRLVTAFGETKTVVEWVEDPRCTVSDSALRLRLFRLKWDVEEAITKPNGSKRGKLGAKT